MERVQPEPIRCFCPAFAEFQRRRYWLSAAKTGWTGPSFAPPTGALREENAWEA
jgi:hypothetical protein